MKSLIIGLMATLLTVTPIQAMDNTAEKRELVTRVLEVTGAGENGEQFIDLFLRQITLALVQSNPDLPIESLAILQNELQTILQEELLIKQSLQTLLFPVYYKYFSADELQELVYFYSTPVGRKTLHVMPLMTQESIVVGQKWIRSLAPVIRERIVTRLEQEGIDLQ